VDDTGNEYSTAQGGLERGRRSGRGCVRVVSIFDRVAVVQCQSNSGRRGGVGEGSTIAGWIVWAQATARRALENASNRTVALGLDNISTYVPVTY